MTIFFHLDSWKEIIKKSLWRNIITLLLTLGLLISPVKKVSHFKQPELHIKSADRHQYLHYTSTQPEHNKRSVVSSQTLRISRLCSEENDFKNYKSQMKSWFLKRGCPEKLIENEMRKVKFGKERIKKAKGVKGIPFVVTYHPQLKNLGRIINQNIYLLNMNEETKKVFSP